MRTIIKVERAACCTFNNLLNREIASINGVYGVNIDNFKKEVTIDHTNDVSFEHIVAKLEENQYKVLPGQVPQKMDYTDFEWPQEKPEEDYFIYRAAKWDTPQKQEMASLFVAEMKKNTNFTKTMDVMDFGCGTGLVGLQIAPFVRNVTMLDTSANMLEELGKKLKHNNAPNHNIKVVKGDFTTINQEEPGKQFDVIFSLMALHHIDKIDELLKELQSNIKSGGLLIIGDLKEEDGSFHGGDKVAHNGFDIPTLVQRMENQNFAVVSTKIYNTLHKADKKYEQFILIAQKEK